jgi:probable rRNA maturation factor
LIEVEVTGLAVSRLPRREIEEFARRCIRAVRAGSRELTIAIVGDAEMARLNQRFRGKKKPTDVLTFPGEGSYLGDVVISLDRARAQARDEGHSTATEVRYLVLHGVLHAFGYDHETDEGEMNRLELRIRKKVGLE